jgi:hypothetical protein
MNILTKKAYISNWTIPKKNTLKQEFIGKPAKIEIQR